MVEEMESVVAATPLAFVVLCAGFTPPLPDVTVHVTTTPGTARPLASCAVTLRGAGSGLLKYQLCVLPPVITSSAGGPGGCVPPPHAKANSPTPRVYNRFQRATTMLPPHPTHTPGRKTVKNSRNQGPRPASRPFHTPRPISQSSHRSGSHSSSF